MARPRFILLLLVSALIFSSCFLEPAFAQIDEDEDEIPEPTTQAQDAAGKSAATEVVKAAAEGEDDEEEVEEVKLLPAPGVQATAIFPKFFGKAPNIHAGEEVEILFAISNGASSPIFLSNATGVLFLPFDYRYIAQNFTGNSYNATLAPNVQSSFSFSFQPDRKLQARDFGLAVVAYYSLDGAPHASLLFNGTFELLEPRGAVSGETIFLLMLAVGLLVLGGMWVQGQLQAAAKKSKKPRKVETGTGTDSETEDNEWLQGTFFQQKKAGQGAKSRKKRA